MVFGVIGVLGGLELRHGSVSGGSGAKTHVQGMILALPVANAILLNRLGVYIRC